jgi:hypothetical protein
MNELEIKGDWNITGEKLEPDVGLTLNGGFALEA